MRCSGPRSAARGQDGSHGIMRLSWPDGMAGQFSADTDQLSD
jgi:hypothetical protein